MKSIKSFFTLATVILSISFAACGSDDDCSPVSFKNMEIVAGNSAIIENGGDVTWTSDNEYIATVSDNTITAKRIGTVKISSSKGSFNVTVKPQYNLYTEPCMEWGCSSSHVKSFMSSYTLRNETSNAFIYTGNGAASYTGYILKNGRLTSAAAYVPTSYLNSLAGFINERYIYVTKTDEATMHLSLDKKTIVMVSAEYLNSSYYYVVMYADYSSLSTSSAKGISFESLTGTRTLTGDDDKTVNNLVDDFYNEVR